MTSRPDSRRCRSGYGRAHVRNDIRRGSLRRGWKGTLIHAGKGVHLEPDIGTRQKRHGRIERLLRSTSSVNETVYN